VSDNTLDSWETLLQEKKEALQLCQKKLNVDSCLKCERLLDCEIRDAYVKAVYDSMNKGKGGGFEF